MKRSVLLLLLAGALVPAAGPAAAKSSSSGSSGFRSSFSSGTNGFQFTGSFRPAFRVPTPSTFFQDAVSAVRPFAEAAAALRPPPATFTVSVPTDVRVVVPEAFRAPADVDAAAPPEFPPPNQAPPTVPGQVLITCFASALGQVISGDISGFEFAQVVRDCIAQGQNPTQ